MAKKTLKAQLYDKPRYAFDEEQLFHHWHDEKERDEFETETFPWWTPTWNEPNWRLVNPYGKFFDFWEFYKPFSEPDYPGYQPELRSKLTDGSKYHWSPVFFINWMKAVVYDRSIYLWNQNEKRFKLEFPNKKPDQIARMCDEENAKYFESLKGES